MAHDTRETLEDFNPTYVWDDLLDRLSSGEFDEATMQEKYEALAEGFRSSSLPETAVRSTLAE